MCERRYIVRRGIRGREYTGGKGKGEGTYFIKCLCFADVSLAVTGDIRLSVGETILRASERSVARGRRNT
jgi:hypothetical protein